MHLNRYEAIFRLLKGFPPKSGMFFVIDVLSLWQWTKDKSRMSFELARKFPFQWVLKHICFIKKRLRKRSLNNNDNDSYLPHDDSIIAKNIYTFILHVSRTYKNILLTIYQK